MYDLCDVNKDVRIRFHGGTKDMVEREAPLLPCMFYTLSLRSVDVDCGGEDDRRCVWWLI